jgi:chondroitin 4-sulfotransferase 11
MSLSGRMLLAMLPRQERDHLLSYIPEKDRRYIEKILKGRARYPECFDQRQALFIHIPKTAGRSLVKSLFNVNSVEHANAEWYQRIDPDRFDRYFKFAIVRNPWDRLVSAWTYLREGGAKSSEDDTAWGEFFHRFDNFEDFVCHWLTPENIRRKHLFTPQSEFVTDRFGGMAMDFVGRYERLNEDFDVICEKLGMDVKLPHLNSSKRVGYREFYTDRSRDVVAEIYARDVELFQYQF